MTPPSASDQVGGELDRARSASEWVAAPVARLAGDSAPPATDHDLVRRPHIAARWGVHGVANDHCVAALLLGPTHWRRLLPRRDHTAVHVERLVRSGQWMAAVVTQHLAVRPSWRRPGAQHPHRLPERVRGGHQTQPQPGSYSVPGPN